MDMEKRTHLERSQGHHARHLPQAELSRWEPSLISHRLEPKAVRWHAGIRPPFSSPEASRYCQV